MPTGCGSQKSRMGKVWPALSICAVLDMDQWYVQRLIQSTLKPIYAGCAAFARPTDCAKTAKKGNAVAHSCSTPYVTVRARGKRGSTIADSHAWCTRWVRWLLVRLDLFVHLCRLSHSSRLHQHVKSDNMQVVTTKTTMLCPATRPIARPFTAIRPVGRLQHVLQARQCLDSQSRRKARAPQAIPPGAAEQLTAAASPADRAGCSPSTWEQFALKVSGKSHQSARTGRLLMHCASTSQRGNLLYGFVRGTNAAHPCSLPLTLTTASRAQRSNSVDLC